MATFTVTNLSDSGPGSLRESILDANAQEGADEIIFEELSGGTIDLISGELTISDDLTIDGLGADLLTVDASANSRVFNISDEDDSNNIDVLINGLTITGGATPEIDSGDFRVSPGGGGGILNAENLTVTDSTISGNSAGNEGGGIANDYFGNLTVTNSTISGNSADDGGGLFSFTYEGFVEVNNSTVSGNSASGNGGGITNATFGSVEVNNSTISDNSADFGGGIANADFGSIEINNSTVSGNSADNGGGIGSFAGVTEVDSSTITGNTATEDGGGINNYVTSYATIINSTISGNAAGEEGGGVYSIYGSLEVANSTISGNAASDGGGIFNGVGVYGDQTPATIDNTVIAGNNGTPLDVNGDFNSNGFNIIGDTTGSTGFEDDLVEPDITQILETDLELNGAPPGTPLTLALVPGSPAIDAGNNADVPPGTEFDQRGPGFERIVNETVDIGAFERQEVPPGGETIVGTPNDDQLEGGTGDDTLTGNGGQDQFVVAAGDGTDAITDFGGVDTGINPSSEVVAEVDALQLLGSGLTPENLLLTQRGANLELTFAGAGNTQVILQNFALEDLDNLPSGIGNILFDTQAEIQDSFDVFNANLTRSSVFGRDTVTFLNDLDNDIRGFNNSDDVINAQGGNDFVAGLSGDDILRGGTGNDVLQGGIGIDTLTGGGGQDQFIIAAEEGTDTITDFEDGQDLIVLDGGLTFAELDIAQGGEATVLRIGDRTLAKLEGVQSSLIGEEDFTSLGDVSFG